MSRVKENNEVMNEIYEAIKKDKVEPINLISAWMEDMSKSLAVIADCMSEESARKSNYGYSVSLTSETVDDGK